jgi:hypothetical protein
MTCRIGVDSGAVARLIVKHRPAQGENGWLGCGGIAEFQGDSAQLSNTTAHNGQPTHSERVR